MRLCFRLHQIQQPATSTLSTIRKRRKRANPVVKYLDLSHPLPILLNFIYFNFMMFLTSLCRKLLPDLLLMCALRLILAVMIPFNYIISKLQSLFKGKVARVFTIKLSKTQNTNHCAFRNKECCY